jgi:septation ring formation regulator EzrA
MILKKIVTIFILIGAIVYTHYSQAQAFSIVKDRYKSRQLENMVFMRWGGFRPKWYYILFHNKYRKGPDRRTMLQLVATDLMIRQTSKKSDEEKEDVEIMYSEEIWDAINRASETHYHLHFKPLFEKLNRDIDALIARGITINTHTDAIQSFRKEQERLNGEIDIVRKGWLEKGDSAEAMKAIEKDLRSLKGNLIKFVNLQTINQKYLSIQP